MQAVLDAWNAGAVAPEEDLSDAIARLGRQIVRGRGRLQEIDIYRGQEIAPDLVAKVQIDIACNDSFVDAAVNAILSAARHGAGWSSAAARPCG